MMTAVTSKEAPGLEFPCEFQIKAMGLDDGQFHNVVLEIISAHSKHIKHDTLTTRPSRAGKYVSVSIVILAQSRAQLDAIYDDLTAHDKVLMRL
jgi:putative lipoic acid-binding regulatory protein